VSDFVPDAHEIVTAPVGTSAFKRARLIVQAAQDALGRDLPQISTERPNAIEKSQWNASAALCCNACEQSYPIDLDDKDTPGEVAYFLRSHRGCRK
jgi:hypothetical protein